MHRKVRSIEGIGLVHPSHKKIVPIQINDTFIRGTKGAWWVLSDWFSELSSYNENNCLFDAGPVYLFI